MKIKPPELLSDDIIEENLEESKDSPKQGLLEERKNKMRGIKTTMKIVDQYIMEVFKKVKEGEEDFVDNLSTPLNKDPLEILLHL